MSTDRRNSGDLSPRYSLAPPKMSMSRLSIKGLSKSHENIRSKNGLSQKPALELTEAQRRFLASSWPSDFQNLHEIGTKILLGIFGAVPAAREAFLPTIPTKELVSAKDLNNKDLDNVAPETIPLFHQHTIRFVQTLSNVVSLANCGVESRSGQLKKMLQNLGQKHRAFEPRGFKPEHFLQSEKVLINVMAVHVDSVDKFDKDQKQAAKEAWRKLSAYIVSELHAGFCNLSD